MKRLGIAGLTTIALMASTSVSAAVESSVAGTDARHFDSIATLGNDNLIGSVDGARKASGMKMRGGMRGHGMKMHGSKMRGHGMKMRGSNFRHMKRGNFNRGHNFRSGKWGHRRGYQRPSRGFQLPSFWIQPSFYIPNYTYYGLSQPSYGYGWSRYYDDAVLTDSRGVVHDTRYDVDWDRYAQGYQAGYSDGRATYDHNVILQDDRVIATPHHRAPVVVQGHQGGTYQGHWDGAYRSDGAYEGQWQGTYQDPEGQVYAGQYAGTYYGSADVEAVDPGVTYDERFDDRRTLSERDEELAYLARCRESSGIGGALVGGAIGALAGNRIAGRGNRLGGSLIGGGVGALAGAAIDQGTDRCRKLLKKYGGREPVTRPHYRPYPHHGSARPAYPQQGYRSGWHGGYYPQYYYPQPAVTTVVISGGGAATTTTTTVTEEVEYVYEQPRKRMYKPKAKKMYKPRAKVWKPAPQLKGCQQADCPRSGY